MVQGFLSNIGGALSGLGGKLGNALNTIRTSDIGKTYDIYKAGLGQGIRNIGDGAKQAFTNQTQFQEDHPVLSGIGNALIGGGLEYLGQKLNEPYVYNQIASRYYGDRYTPVLPQADTQWGRRMSQGIQGLLMGNTGEPIQFTDFE